VKAFNRIGPVVCAIAFVAVAVAVPVTMAQDNNPTQILITNVNIWDGTSDGLANGQSVLVEGNLIKAVGKKLSANKNASVIDGGGRTLMGGLLNYYHRQAA